MSVFPGPVGVVPPTSEVDEMVADAGNIRKMSLSKEHANGMPERRWGFQARLDPKVTLEEYMYWAKIEREMEEVEFKEYKAGQHVDTALGGITKSIAGVFKRTGRHETMVVHDDGASYPASGAHRNQALDSKEKYDASDENSSPTRVVPPSSRGDLDAEWRTATRALRIASWGGVFYLITTDILGWAQAPYVLTNTGYGLGIGMFVLFGIAAFASGWMIWKTFMTLDSSRYPVMSFGDPFFRLFGPKTRHAINFAQAIQMFLTVAVLQLGQTNVVAQLSGSANLCFIVCGVIALVVGMASGYFRALKYISWFSNAAVWINVAAFIITCVAAAKYGPDVTSQVELGILPKIWLEDPAPVKVFAGVPTPEYQPTDQNLFSAEFNGINSIVYAYSGALLFVAFMAEMRHPMDFWKSVLCAQVFICVVYSFFGAFAYTYYGQYAYALVNQTVSPLGLQLVVNTLSLITGWLAIFMYFNVGLKTVYLEVGQEIFGLPPITTNKGKYIWWALGPVYWIIAFVVAMSVPQFTAFANFVGALFALNFTYSFSGIMFVALKTQQHAAQAGEGFDPSTGETTRHDHGIRRLMRGFLRGWKYTVPATIYTMAGLASSGMGTWAAILALEAAFGPGGTVLTSWTCTNPFSPQAQSAALAAATAPAS